jgi:hypothetical protein
LNVRFGNTRCTATVVPPLPAAFDGATHVVFDGRDKSPTVGAGGATALGPSLDDE